MARALDGIRIVDFSKALAGPYCTMLLADMGAEVIKVEMPGVGDDSRGWGPPFIEGEAAYFLSINRNKKSTTLNLKNDQAKEIARRMIEKADVVLESNRPGVMKKLGLDYESVKQFNPNIIYCAISGFGQTGPYSKRPGFDQVIQGYGGLMGLTGEVGGEPIKIGIAITDIATGMFASVGILTALYHRERTGQGQFVDASMLDGQVSWLTYQAGRYFASGQVPQRLGNAHPMIVPYQDFEASDGFINIAAGNDNLWKKFCEVADLTAIAEDPRFATNPKRVENREELVPMISKIIATKTMQEWLDLLNAAGVPCGPIYTIDKIFQDPHVLARDMLQEVEHPTCGPVKVGGVPIKFSETPATVETPPPLLGQHNEEMLQELGFSTEDIERFKTEKVI
ncbi:MAG: CoA transferase [Deltaproteobacteria bacterium]|nr:CoA transferase [Deltaproteobacteria bacterium]